ncbi:MAG: TolC family protein [Gammaproteobacteria bacterium]|nr:TolC family protein [Gammaproteobacteria bacterium]
MKRPYLISIIIVMLFLLSFSTQAAKSVNIGIVVDGPIEHTSWSPELFKNELLALTKGDFKIHFPTTKQIDGNWSAKRIAAALKQLQNDPEIDMVMALGYASSAVATLSKSLRKPTFAPFVMDADIQGLPRKNNTSGVRNLNYLSGSADFVRDLKIFQSVARFKTIAVLIDEVHYATHSGLIRRAKEITASGGIELLFVQQRSRNEDLAIKLPETIDAVVVTDLARLDAATTWRLIKALIEKRLPSYSLLDSQLVEQGLLMAQAPASDWLRLARRNALNMHAVLRGESAQNQAVTFKGKRRLTLNMATARAIGVYPRFDILNEAILLNEMPKPQGRPLSLSLVALESVKANLDLRASFFAVQAGQTNIDVARAGLLPQIEANIDFAQFEDDSIAVKSGTAAEQSTKARLSMSQLLYSDRVRANVEIQAYLQNNRHALNKQLELDIIQESTIVYLNVLKSQTFVHIRLENMKLTRANLELARDRQHIGVANPAEVYRWESELATARQALLDAQAQHQQTRDALNRLLHRPLKEQFIAEPATLNDPTMVVSHPELYEYVNNDHAFELMGEFIIEDGLIASPELASINALIAVTKREHTSNQRSYWSPTVTLQGEVSNVLNESRVSGLSSENQNEWIIGINASLPLFEGNARRAREMGTYNELRQLDVQRDAIKERIEQRIRATLHQISASYPSIQLSKDAATAAHKNLILVTDAYSRGTISILDLLDAQNAALVAEESATNAVFDFLIDLMNLQRNLGEFDFFLDEQGLKKWLERLQLYIATEKKGGD